MDPDVWGPSAWALFHSLASNKIPHSLSEYKEFFMSLRYVLPCCTCRDNYSGHLAALALPKTVEEMPVWVVKLHNRVNKMKGKPIYKGVYKGTTDIWIFLNAIVSTHVYSKTNKADPKEVEALTTFWTFLCPQMDTKKLDVTDRQAMKAWVHDLEKSYCFKDA